jgi:hypothetical protein
LLVSYHEVAFVDASEQDGAEIDRLDPVVDFLESDVVRLERVGDEEELVLEPERPGVGYTLHEVKSRGRKLLAQLSESRSGLPSYADAN